MLRVAIIDYGMGNLFSVKQACEYAGLASVITSETPIILDSDAAILPGVGAFGDAMDNLIALGLAETIRKFVKSGRFFIGICLGMQLLMSESEEFGKHVGLNIIEGKVARLFSNGNQKERIKIPAVGWNQISLPHFAPNGYWLDTPLRDMDNGELMYFVHSYFAVPKNPLLVLSVTNYGGIEYSSSLLERNVFACQFHPEKSAKKGLEIYKNLARMIKKRR